MDKLIDIFNYIERNRLDHTAYYGGHPTTELPEFSVFLGIYLLKLHDDAILDSEDMSVRHPLASIPDLAAWNNHFGLFYTEIPLPSLYKHLIKMANKICFDLDCSYTVDAKIYDTYPEPLLAKVKFKHLIRLSNGYHIGVKELGTCHIAKDTSGFTYMSAPHVTYLLLADGKAEDLLKVPDDSGQGNVLETRIANWFDYNLPIVYVQEDDPYFKAFEGLKLQHPVDNIQLVHEYLKFTGSNITENKLQLLKAAGASFKDVLSLVNNCVHTDLSVELPSI